MKRTLFPVFILTLALMMLITAALPVAAHECPPQPCPCGYEGCTPGFWKNHTTIWVGYNPNQTLESVFDIPDSFALDNVTMLQALSLGGGPGAAGMASNLLRAGVAALLNAFHPDINYPVSEADIIAWTNGSLLGSRQTMELQKNWWDQFNNLGCSIDAHGNPI